jgi:hypothetical protein
MAPAPDAPNPRIEHWFEVRLVAALADFAGGILEHDVR